MLVFKFCESFVALHVCVACNIAPQETDDDCQEESIADDLQ